MKNFLIFSTMLGIIVPACMIAVNPLSGALLGIWISFILFYVYACIFLIKQNEYLELYESILIPLYKKLFLIICFCILIVSFFSIIDIYGVICSSNETACSSELKKSINDNIFIGFADDEVDVIVLIASLIGIIFNNTAAVLIILIPFIIDYIAFSSIRYGLTIVLKDNDGKRIKVFVDNNQNKTFSELFKQTVDEKKRQLDAQKVNETK